MMTTKTARDFLDKELFVKRSIVTFRSLSRELGIHVNDAKSQLQHYYDAVRDTDTPAVPTYLVSGEVPALTVSSHSGTQQSDSSMDLDFEEDQEDTDVVHQSKVLLVAGRALDEAMSQFSRVQSVHIYSLSPSRLGDAGLVCTPSFKVQKADAKGGMAPFSIFGKLTGPHVKLKAGVVHQSAASSSKTTLDIPAKVEPRVVASTGAEQQMTKGKTPALETKERSSTTLALPRTETKDKLKPSGKLDWSKAKAKEKQLVAQGTREEKKPKPEPDLTIATECSSASKKKELKSTEPFPKPESNSGANGDAQKRGIKRKPLLDTDPESGSEPSSVKAKPSTPAGSSIKQGAVYSDEDDDGDVRMLGRRRPKRRSTTMTSDSEMSLRAMMDIDDEQVDRASRVSKVYPQREESEESEEDNGHEKEVVALPATSEDDEFDHVPVVPKRRKPRKVAPLGRNGLKKRRIIKSRTTTDAKGYMQTEDYSSYESVEEEEAEVKPKGKRRETKRASESKVEGAGAKVVAREESTKKLKAKGAPKPRGGAPQRGGLLNFFGPGRGKK